jgi:hypothetical protein
VLLFLYKNIHAPLQLAPRSVQKECYEIHNLDDDLNYSRDSESGVALPVDGEKFTSSC